MPITQGDLERVIREGKLSVCEHFGYFERCDDAIAKARTIEASTIDPYTVVQIKHVFVRYAFQPPRMRYQVFRVITYPPKPEGEIQL